MPAWQRRFVVVCASVIGFCLLYTTCDYAEWPRLAYLPLERSWTVISGPGGPLASTYLGMVLWGVAGAVIGGGAVWLATGFTRGELSQRWLDLARAWAIAGFLLAGTYFTWKEWPF